MVERPTLFQFVVLSMLLHLLLIVLIGDSIRAGARRGDSFWGSLDVTLRRMSPEPGAGLKLAPGAETTLPGAALLRRFGAADAPAPARVEPRPPITLPPMPQERRIEDAPAAGAPPSAQETPSPPPASRPFEALPPVDLNAAQEVDKPLAPPAVSPPVVDRRPSPAVIRRPPVVPIAPPLLERVVPRTIERELAPSVELTPRETPVSPAPLERIEPRQIEREPVPPVELHPRELPMTPEAIERIAPAKIERELAPATELEHREKPLVSAPMERIAPARVDREMIVPAPASTRPVERATAPEERAAPGVRDTAPAMPTPSKSEPGEPAPRLRFGTPQPDEDIFKPRRDVVVPSSEPGGLPRIDRDAMRSRVREIAREGSSRATLVQLDVPLLERPPKNSFEKAAKPDCRTAYAGLGLLAIPVLLASALADSGCRW